MSVRTIKGQQVWMVGVAVPPQAGKHPYTRTTTIMVVAATPERAIDCARVHFGPCEVYSVVHHVGRDRELLIAEEAIER